MYIAMLKKYWESSQQIWIWHKARKEQTSNNKSKKGKTLAKTSNNKSFMYKTQVDKDKY